MSAKFSELIQSDTPVLVDFFATWCGPCHAMAPILQDVAARTEGRARVIKVDVDKNPMAAAKYQIEGVPTLILFKNGQVLWRQSGVVSAGTLMKVLEPHFASS